MKVTNIDQLKNIANNIRKEIIKTNYIKGGSHLGGPLSCTDILTALYFNIMNIDSLNPKSEDRDRFILSKGHCAIALYATLAQRGYFLPEELKSFGQLGSMLQVHPDMNKLPGIDFSTGSLGQGISGAVGMALAAKLTGKNYKVYCLVGDGETQEGQFWEAIDMASKYKLDNLIVILDNNKLQQYGFVDEGIIKNPIIDIHQKLEAFDWKIIKVNGHSFEELLGAIKYLSSSFKDMPKFIGANTIKGKGISFMENDYLYHSKALTEEEYNNAMEELNGE